MKNPYLIAAVVATVAIVAYSFYMKKQAAAPATAPAPGTATQPPANGGTGNGTVGQVVGTGSTIIDAWNDLRNIWR